MEKITYQKAGVDPEKAASILGSFASYLSTRPRDPRLLSGIGPFASCYSLKDLIQDAADPILVTCCDGVGTKLKLALDWNDLSGLGHDLVAMNVNDLLCAGAKPLLFLDYYACGQLKEAQLSQLLRSIQAGCELAQCSLAGGETAELPGLYQADDFDLAGFSVGIADRSELLSPAKVTPGDRIIAIESSGFHSNGYSLVRKLVDKTGIKPTDCPEFSSETWAQLLLKPTLIYVPWLTPILKARRVHALAHITGGGLYENLPRVLPTGIKAVIDSQAWNIPPLFTWAQKAAGLSTEQLLSTFNCGVGMLAMTTPAEAKTLIAELGAAKLRAWDVGQIEATDGKGPQVVWQ
jgi:phosphoribosylformylglycinamidine cyclo-ligase